MLSFVLVVLPLLAGAAPARAAFGISDFEVGVRNSDGTVDERAGTVPFALDVHLVMNTDQAGEPEGILRGLRIDLPSGLIGNPQNVPRCTQADFEGIAPRCPAPTQIGILSGIVTGLGQITAPVYNLAPSPGSAAVFAVSINGQPMVQRLNLVGGGAHTVRLSGNLPPSPAIVDVEEEIWGVPASPLHDLHRFCRGANGQVVEGCPSTAEEQPLLTLPASCAEPMRTALTVTSADLVPATASATALSRDAAGNPRPLVGCDALPFDPQFTVGTEVEPQAPSGLSLRFEMPLYLGAARTAAAAVTGVKVELPAGLALNPSAGSWLAACPPAAVGLQGPPGVQPTVFDQTPVSCPPSSRLGSVRVSTPILDHELEGAVYLASPEANPFASRLAIYLVVEDADTGTLLKIPVRLDADPGDGRLTATIPELPRVPFRELEIAFADGPQAPLSGPPGCGSFATEATFAPSTAPFAPAAVRDASLTVAGGTHGTACPPPETERNPAPSFHAGVEAPRAGGASPLTIRLSRQDSDQHLGAFDLTLPPGLLAQLGSIPVGSAVGAVRVEAGLGPSPLRREGTAYLGGPYRGAPYSLKVVVPAQAGPIDLGTIVQRAALDVDPATAQISVRSDPLPQILGGVPLEVRAITLDLDRPGFIRNPTSCEPMAIAGTATTSLGRTAAISERFQVGDCAVLPFKPRLSLGLSGAVGRGGHPALRAVYRGDPGGAAASGIAFRLPAGELLDLRHLGRLCPRDVEAGRCPRDSRFGSLRIDTPMLDASLEGPVYLRVPSGRLPGLTAEVRSGGLRFLLRGRVTGRGGRLGISLESLPDVPLSKAVLTLPGGRRGLVVNSESLCAGSPGTATASFSAHSGKQLRLHPRLRVAGC